MTDRVDRRIFPTGLNKNNAINIINNAGFTLTQRMKSYPQNFNFAFPESKKYGPFVEAFINADNTRDRPAMPDQDAKWERRDAVVDPMSGMANLGSPAMESAGVVGKAIVPEAYFDYMEQKAANEQYADFRNWKVNQIDWKNPVKRAYWEKKDPGLLAEAEKNLVFQNWIELQTYLIKSRGIKNEQDAFIIYMAENGFDYNQKWIPYNVQGAFERYYAGFIAGQADRDERGEHTNYMNVERPDTLKEAYTSTPGTTRLKPGWGEAVEYREGLDHMKED